MSKLREYARKRRFEATPEPAGQEPEASAARRRFVIQEHHARRLHWDFRLERDGVLVSWAIPKGIPADPKTNHLAVRVEDHPLDYIDFAGEIPSGNYGAGRVLIWDRGTYEEHKFRETEVMVTLHGERVQGKYVLFQTRGSDWMIHRMDPPQDPEREPMPDSVQPMMPATSSSVPSPEQAYGFEFKWDGIRALVHVSGGRALIKSRTLEDITRRYPEMRELGPVLGAREAILDGEIVALGPDGRPSFEQIQQRMGLNSEAEVRRKMKEVPVIYMIFDVLYADGRSLMELPYQERRRRLEALSLNSGFWQTPSYQAGEGATLLEASRAARLEGVVAKRLDSVYQPGRRSSAWVKVKNLQRQDLVIGGWLPGQGQRADHLSALLAGYYDAGKLVYAGRVGTGFTAAMLHKLAALMEPMRTDSNPFQTGKPPADAHFVEPKLVADVEFREWTKSGQLRAASFRGLRQDEAASGGGQ